MIAEEWDEQSGESLARRLATARGIDWLYMDMRTEEKIRAGIEEKQRDRRVSGQQLKLPSDDLREHAWADKLEASGREHVLVVCGYFHLDGLVRKLRARGHETAQRVYLESVTEIRES